MDAQTSELIKTLIQTQIIQALNSAPDAVEKMVKSALSERVDESGNPKGYGAKMPYLDWMVGNEIRSAAREACRVVSLPKKGEFWSCIWAGVISTFSFWAKQKGRVRDRPPRHFLLFSCQTLRG